MSTEKILEAIKENKIEFGTKRALKLLKENKVKEIYISSTYPERLTNELKHAAEINKIPVNRLEINSEELSVLCKKPFLISVAIIKQEK
ncbi:hypothetical protein GF374_01080 [Candidatus Woesearchaeota archaeon]|nr:hypothetical protein [Candidatus Woesearchaeota archaeon]